MTTLADAQAAHDAQRWVEAADAYERHLAETGDSGVLLALGDVSADAGRLDRASAVYSQLIDRGGPEVAVAAARLGVVELRLQRPDVARAAFRLAYSAGYAPSLAELEARTPEPEGEAPIRTERAAVPRGRDTDLVVGVLRGGETGAFATGAGRCLEVRFIGEAASTALLLGEGGLAQLPGGVSKRRSVNRLFQTAREIGADALLSFDAQAGERLAAFSWTDPLSGFASLATKDGRLAALRVHGRVLAEFGGLDAVYDETEAALADLMARSNRAGFGDHSRLTGEAWTFRGEGLDEQILRRRFPEHDRAAGRVIGRARARAERLKAALRARPERLLLDLSYLRPHFDGISEVTRSLTAALETLDAFQIHLLCDGEAARFHGLQRFQATGRLVEHAAPGGYAACLRLAQPFDLEDLERTWSAAPVAGFLMHDPITLDCDYLGSPGLESVVRRALAGSELIGFVSRFSEDQFARRFDIPDTPGRFVALNSTSVDDYPGSAAAGPPGDGVLVVGNAFAHKNLLETVRRLRRELPDVAVTVLGVGRPPEPGLTWFRSGDISPEKVDALYRAAGVVIYPSFYEGFGLPIMHSLARRRPVLALDQPAYREIRAASRLGGDIHLFDTTDALVGSVRRLLQTPRTSPREDVVEQRWSDSARAIASAVRAAADAFSERALTARIADSLERREAARHVAVHGSRESANPPREASVRPRLVAGASLRRGERLASDAGVHALHFQLDSNLVLYAAAHGTPHLALWAAGRHAGAEALILGEDGRLELRDGAGMTLWSVQGPKGAWLEVRPGRVVLADEAGVHWEVPDPAQLPVPQPAFERAPGVLYEGDVLRTGDGLTSRRGALRLLLGPGELTVIGAVDGDWSASLDGAADRLVMQDDGNLVVYSADGQALWSTGTSGHAGAWARLDDCSGLLVENAVGELWCTSGQPVS